MERINCWEAKQCGREPGGANVAELGVCPAALPGAVDGVNKGTHAGRVCWAIAGTCCHGQVQGTFARKLLSCLECAFLQQVNEEEGANFVLRPTCLGLEQTSEHAAAGSDPDVADVAGTGVDQPGPRRDRIA